MKYILTTLLASLLLLSPLGLQSQSVIMPPQFEGGRDSLDTFFAQNMKYPLEAEDNSKEAIVRVSMVIDSLGRVESINPVKDYGYGFNDEAVRLVKLLPDWKPAMKDGMPIKTRYTIPVHFRLERRLDNANFEHGPQYPGGNAALRDFIGENLEYPDSGDKEGAVVIQVKINKAGEIIDRRVVKTLGQAFTEAAYSVLDIMPNWEPAVADGRPIPMWYSLPFGFTKDENQREGRSFTFVTKEQKEVMQASRDREKDRVTRIDKNRSKTEDFVPAEFPGGEVALQEYITKNLEYPKKAFQLDKEGTATVRFTVRKNGHIKHIDVISSDGFGMAKQAELVVFRMPKWIPAYDGKKDADDTVVLRIPFLLPSKIDGYTPDYQIASQDDEEITPSVQEEEEMTDWQKKVAARKQKKADKKAKKTDRPDEKSSADASELTEWQQKVADRKRQKQEKKAQKKVDN